MHAGRLACGDADRQLELAVGLEGRGEVRYPLVQRGLIALVLAMGCGSPLLRSVPPWPVSGPAAAVPLRCATGAFHQRHPQRRGSRVAPLAPAPSSST